MTNQKRIIGIGRAFTDVIADVDDAFLEKHDIPKGIGLRIEEEQLTKIISELRNPIFMAGGSVANTMAGLNALGAPVSFVGKVGDDDAGYVFRKEFYHTGVEFLNPPVENGVSGTCLCLNTPDGDRSFAFSVGVCEDLSPEDIRADMFDHANMMLLQVLMLETHMCYETVRELLPQLPQHVKKVMCFQDLHDKGKVSELVMQNVDILIGSRTEYDDILGIKEVNELKSLCESQNIIAAMTAGAEGAYLFSAKETEHIKSVKPSRIVDTVGAGDYFAAGLLYGLSENWSLKESGDLGAKCASLIIEEVGGRPIEQTAQKMRQLVS